MTSLPEDREGQEVGATAPQSRVSKAFHPDREGCDCEKQGLMDEDECIHDEPCWISREVYQRMRGVTITITREDAQCLYDHTGTMPFLAKSWPNNVRAALSEALALDIDRSAVAKEVAVEGDAT